MRNWLTVGVSEDDKKTFFRLCCGKSGWSKRRGWFENLDHPDGRKGKDIPSKQWKRSGRSPKLFAQKPDIVVGLAQDVIGQ